MSYILGAEVRFGWRVFDEDGALTDPTSNAVTLTLPDGTVDAPSATSDGTGVLVVYFTPTMAGLHTWRATTTGPATATEGSFTVEREDEVSIVSLAEIKAQLRVRDSAGDDALAWYALVASAACESYDHGTGRVWRRRTITAEQHLGINRARVMLHETPVAEVTSVVEDDVLLDSDSWRLRPHGILERACGRWGDTEVSYITAAEIPPADVRNGVVEMVRHLRSHDVGGSGLPRQENFEWSPSLGYLVPNRVEEAWRSYRSIVVR